MPSYDQSLMDDAIERRVRRMQSAIELGRLIRDRKNISLKTPLNSVTVVDSDLCALDDYREV